MEKVRGRQLETKECRQIQLDILCEIKAVCERHDLRYILDYGSLLGAVRHGGFIPWDDDIDISMPRPDYECFKEAFEKEQRADTGIRLLTGMRENLALPYIQVVKENTITVKKGRRKAYAQAVWVDVFPVDGADAGEKTEEIYRLYWEKIEEVRKIIGRYRPYRNPWKQLRQFYFHYIKKFRLGKIVREAEHLMQTLDYCASDEVFCYQTIYGTREKNQKKYYEERIEMPFEGISCKVPRDYDEKLRGIYGDYEKIPPEEERKGHEFAAYYQERKMKLQ